MTSLLARLVLLCVGLLAARAPAAGANAWEKLYELPSRNRWINAVWMARDGSWRAGGPGFIVSGGTGSVTPTDLGAFYVTSFGEDSNGSIVAVGGRQAIWQEEGGAFRRVHERSGPERKGRGAHEDVLDGVGYLDSNKPERLVAYGSLHLSFWRDPGGKWEPANTDALAKRGTLGPNITPPSGCHIAGWHWLERATALFDCHEGSGFWYEEGAAPMPLGRLPKPCQTSMLGVARSEKKVFVACGSPARIWRGGLDTSDWTLLAGVDDVTSLHARNNCLLVGTRHALYRRCGSL